MRSSCQSWIWEDYMIILQSWWKDGASLMMHVMLAPSLMLREKGGSRIAYAVRHISEISYCRRVRSTKELTSLLMQGQ
jgi:hypothetical protein